MLKLAAHVRGLVPARGVLPNKGMKQPKRGGRSARRAAFIESRFAAYARC